jgi:hypothetical protein
MDGINGFEVYMVSGSLSHESKYRSLDNLFWNNIKGSSKFDDLKKAKKAKKLFKALFPNSKFCIKGF